MASYDVAVTDLRLAQEQERERIFDRTVTSVFPTRAAFALDVSALLQKYDIRLTVSTFRGW